MVQYIGLEFMLAISISWGSKPTKRNLLRCKHFLCVFCLASLMSLTLSAPAQDDPHLTTIPQKTDFASRAEKIFQAAKALHESQPTNAEAAWQFGRACYDWADFATTKSQREAIANQGIATCRGLIQGDPNSAQGHYYLALNLGQLARTRKMEALKLVDQMEAEFKIVLNLDPKLDYAGADRGLGLLFLNTPGWPLSIGSKSKARLHLQKAEKLFPNYPENLLNLIEAHLKWGDRNAALRELRNLDEIWPAARKEFTGEGWAASWADWEGRRDFFYKKATQSSKALEAPHEH
jgi:tetratricopeptide (TPR) repeat protein